MEDQMYLPLYVRPELFVFVCKTIALCICMEDQRFLTLYVRPELFAFVYKTRPICLCMEDQISVDSAPALSPRLVFAGIVWMYDVGSPSMF